MIALDLKPSPKILRQFAWIAVVGLPLLAAAFSGWHFTHPAVLWLLGLGVVQLVLFLTVTDRLSWLLFVSLSLVAVPIGFVLSHVLMAAIYYLVVTPIGLVFRLLGRDAMGRRFVPGATSYWHVRQAVRPKASYFKLY